MAPPLSHETPDVEHARHAPPMIIPSLLDTDLYKFTMMQVVLHHFPGAQVEYRFKCRNAGVDLHAVHRRDRATRSRRSARCASRRDELDYLRGWRFFKSDFVDLLGLFQLDERFIQRQRRSKAPTARSTSRSRGRGCTRSCSRCRCSRSCREVYNRNAHPQPDFAEGRRRLRDEDRADQRGRRIPSSASPTTARAGASRATWQDEVLRTLQRGIGPKFVGTSNVALRAWSTA